MMMELYFASAERLFGQETFAVSPVTRMLRIENPCTRYAFEYLLESRLISELQ